MVDELARSRADRGRVHTPTLRGLGERRDELAPDVGSRAHVDDIVELLERADMTDVAWLTEMCTPQPLLSFTETTSLYGTVDSIPTRAIAGFDGR